MYTIIVTVENGLPNITSFSNDLPDGEFRVGGHEDMSGHSINIVRVDPVGRYMAEAQHYFKPEQYEEVPQPPPPPTQPAARYVGEPLPPVPPGGSMFERGLLSPRTHHQHPELGGQGSSMQRRDIGQIGSQIPDGSDLPLPEWPQEEACPKKCGCIIRTDEKGYKTSDADRRECGCDGPCTDPML